MKPVVVWFRRDLRLRDNSALAAAAAQGGSVIPLYIHAPSEEGDWAPGAASRWWLQASLAALQEHLQHLGSQLIIRAGAAKATLEELCGETGAEAVFCNRLYEPALLARDSLLARQLKQRGIQVCSFNSQLLFDPWEIQSLERKPYRVFTPFWKQVLQSDLPAIPIVRIPELKAPRRWPKSVSIDSLRLRPAHSWASGLSRAWEPGENGAQTLLKRFLSTSIIRYPEGRDRPDASGTSRLSPHLHFGEIGPRQVWHEVQKLAAKKPDAGLVRGAEAFLRELGWREFGAHLLYHFPHTPAAPLFERYKRFPWRSHDDDLAAWQKGRTGYPIVDAGMRELWATGWMHNRVRMVAASFLVKDLLISWQEGARWFWNTLVDADLASNTLGWQWTAGCGADAAPYFRIFNPVLQGKRFDPEGIYVRKWVPELANVPAHWIHCPWQAPRDILMKARVRLGADYPLPIIDHAHARQRALLALEEATR